MAPVALSNCALILFGRDHPKVVRAPKQLSIVETHYAMKWNYFNQIDV